VAVTGDTLNEPNETFAVDLSGPANATLGDAQGIGTITNNDALPSIAISDVSVTEGNAGASSAVFAVTLSAASGQAITVAYGTADGTAAAGTDYVAATGNVTFPVGTVAQTIAIAVNGDTAIETVRHSS
jgi:hypothetical protein